VGRSVPMRDAEEVVTGTLRYVSEHHRDDMLHAAIVRARVPHGILREVDPSAALAIPGVVKVLTSADVPYNRHGFLVPDWPVLAEDRVNQFGDPVALVAADTMRAAAEGARAVRVEIDPLDVVSDPEVGGLTDLDPVHADVMMSLDHEKGDVVAALAASTVVVEQVVHTPAQEHLALEPGGGMALWEHGRLTVWFGCHDPHQQAREIALALGIAEGDVRVISAPMGGAFGSKGAGPVAIHLGLLAVATGRPVRIVLSRDEVMVSGVKRHPARIHTRLGVDESGTIRAVDMHALVDAGPYVASTPIFVKVSSESSTGAYRVPDSRFSIRAVPTNNATSGAFRGVGSSEMQFALESALDEAACRLGLAGDEIRRRNVLHVGDEHGAYGHVISAGFNAAKALDSVTGHRWWTGREEWKQAECAPWRRGVGIALGVKGVGSGAGRNDVAAARLAIDREGRIRIWAGPAHAGQFIQTAYAQIAAEVLGLDVDDIEILIGDTELVPPSGGCTASRSTYAGGSAVRLVAQGLLERAGAPGDRSEIDWRAVGTRLAEEGRALVEAEFAMPEVTEIAPLKGVGLTDLGPHDRYGTAAQVARVEVNERTGEVIVDSVACAVDCGFAINPAAVVGQSNGGIVQQVGFTLMEEYLLDEAVPSTTSLSTYLIPTAVDAPRIETIIVQDAAAEMSDAKGIAEAVAVPTAPAIATAIRDAVGVRIDRLPATAERIHGLIETGRAPVEPGPER
jgi:CO/xanthine dehydrogenase Mo-binding subunit